MDRVGKNDATELIMMPLREAYFRFAVREDNEAAGREKWAREVYDIYQTQMADGTRTALPDFDVMRYMALVDFMEDPFFPEDLKLRLMGRMKLDRPGLFEKLVEEFEAFRKRVEASQPQTP